MPGYTIPGRWRHSRRGRAACQQRGKVRRDAAMERYARLAEGYLATLIVPATCLGCNWQYTRCSETILSMFSSGTVMVFSSPGLMTSLTFMVSIAKPWSAASVFFTFNVTGPIRSMVPPPSHIFAPSFSTAVNVRSPACAGRETQTTATRARAITRDRPTQFDVLTCIIHLRYG